MTRQPSFECALIDPKPHIVKQADQDMAAAMALRLLVSGPTKLASRSRTVLLGGRGLSRRRLFGTNKSSTSSSTGAEAIAAPVLEALAKRKRVYTATYKRGAKPSVVILGSGWAGYQLARSLDKRQYDVTVVSDRNHFLFTPLLPSTTVGTLEYRVIQEPVRTVPGITYYQAKAKLINLEDKNVVCEETFKPDEDMQIPFDYLIVAVGSTTNTFGIPGVSRANHVYFLKQLADARAIRGRIIECFERASYPGTPQAEQARLLSFLVVGGGPTSVELSSELYDFLKKDVHKYYPDLEDQVSVTLVEASDHILGTFDCRLVDYVSSLFAKRRIRVLTNTSVVKVEKNVAFLQDGQPLHFGLCVWSTGVKATPLIEGLGDQVQKGRGGRVLVDARLRIVGHEDKGVFSLGDCAISEARPLPPLAQAAQQQAKYLASVFNTYNEPHANPDAPAFQYKHLGSMAQLGMWQGVVDAGKLEQEGEGAEKVPPKTLTGVMAFLLWRSAYWTKSVSIQNKILIPMYWFKSWIFGRDISGF